MLKPLIPGFVLAGYKNVCSMQATMVKAWAACGLLEAWNPHFQLEAYKLKEAGTLFPKQQPETLEPEPSVGLDPVDDDGVPIQLPAKTRGRPAGSKNKAKPAATASALDSQPDPSQPAAPAQGVQQTTHSAPAAAARKRGRPPGSKNKPKPAAQQAQEATPAEPQATGQASAAVSKKRGRPLGSKNSQAASTKAASNSKRGRGRPRQTRRLDSESEAESSSDSESDVPQAMDISESDTES